MISSLPALRVAVVEDDRATREGLRLLIDGTPGFRCAAVWGSVEQALRDLTPPGPDVLLLDIQLPGLPGSEGVRLLRERCPDTAVVMLTLYEDENRIFESLCNGASGYLLKKTPPARLLEAIREARDHGSPLSPEVALKVVRLFRELPPPVRIERDLTPQEVRLLSLLARGYSYQAAAEDMTISVNTVRNYVRSVYEKLHVHSKSEAVSKALRARLI
jgi:DNA-binding NarL/FixJ family response regulator